MSLESTQITRKNRVYAPIIFAVSLIIALFVLRPAYAAYQETQNKILSLETQKNQKDAEYQAFLALESRIQDPSQPLSVRIKKIEKPWNEADIFEAIMVNDFTRAINTREARIVVGSVRLQPGVKLPSGMMMGSVSIDIQSGSMDDIVSYLTYLTQDTGYAFVLDNINLPLDSSAIMGATS